MTGTAGGRGERGPGGFPETASVARARGSGAAELSGFPFLLRFPLGFHPPLADVTAATPSLSPQPRGTWLPPRPRNRPRDGVPLSGRGQEGRGAVPRLPPARACEASMPLRPAPRVTPALKTVLRVEGGTSPSAS